MRIPSLASNERSNSLTQLWNAAGTSLVAFTVALLATSCGGDSGGGAAANAISKASSSALPPSPTSVQMQTSSSNILTAFFDSRSADGCMDTTVAVNAFSGTTRVVSSSGTPHTTIQDLGVFVTVFDYCRQLLLLSAFGDNPQPATFQISPNLNSGHITGDVTLVDTVTAITFDVQVDVTWTGNGQLVGSTLTQHTSSFPGGVVNTHFTGFSRPAVASGTVMSATTNYTPAASAFAELDRADSGEIDITPVASGTSASATP
ncbi:hypothetical protein [Paraburkholderia diazotrophica]|uniref:Uncharacterized protein n=1 Tax=Paraburkholderia diazotrophica TaxID=667676 RepID=A0A1H7E069_9BURK|nr:hypothetical protein [Paraburkholderia diazotrophica]SEK07351.1 hypothetical protein SAMN05192539_103848 [Paraburkholderia diazotrophica]